MAEGCWLSVGLMSSKPQPGQAGWTVLCRGKYESVGKYVVVRESASACAQPPRLHCVHIRCLNTPHEQHNDRYGTQAD